MTKTAKPGPPLTLMAAHEELVRVRPDRTASLPVWLSYYQQSVAVYEQVATTDPWHDGEARYWAARERVHARGIEARMRALVPG
ncbi:MAG: AMED_5909 family protein [Pseudonocardiaceae bacterium]